jgi:hypothetical protein
MSEINPNGPQPQTGGSMVTNNKYGYSGPRIIQGLDANSSSYGPGLAAIQNNPIPQVQTPTSFDPHNIAAFQENSGRGNPAQQIGQVSATTQIGAPTPHAAPLGPTQGANGLRAQMTGAGGQIGGGAGTVPPGSGQSGPTGSLYAPPDDGTGQQVGQVMGRLMANLFNPK